MRGKAAARLIATNALLAAKIVGTVAGLAAMLLAVAWLIGTFNEKVSPGEQAPAVRRLDGQPTDQVREVTKEYFEEAIGTLKAANRTVIAAKILASIEQLDVNAGDQVEAGQVLATLASEELNTRVNQAKEALAAATTTRNEAEADYRRAVDTNKRNPGTIAGSTIDKHAARVGTTRAEERRLRQVVSEAEVMLSYTVIKALKAGRVVDRLAEPGNTVRPGEPLLVVYDETSLRLEAPVVETRAVTLEVDQPLTVRIDALDRELTAPVDEIVPQAQALSRSFLVKVSMPQADDLYEGMFGRMLIPAGRRRHLCVPIGAIRTLGQLQFVDVVGPDEALQRRMIRTGRVGVPGRIEVLSGVQVGERVVVYAEPTETVDAPATEGHADDR